MPSPDTPRVRAAFALSVLFLLAAGFYLDHREDEAAKVTARAELVTGGETERGRERFLAYGCGGCHAVKGVPGARGLVGPPLDGLGSRAMLGGRLENRPEHLMRWIGEPQAISPGTAMPNLGVSARDRRDIAAFLYSRS